MTRRRWRWAPLDMVAGLVVAAVCIAWLTVLVLS